MEEDVIEMYRRMVFNVLIDNQDDHGKNFSFLYDEEKGKGKIITDKDMLLVAKKIN